jgi:hypothetical protein
MKAVNHALVEQLLADEPLSYKEIARRASCSDFSVRTIARKVSGDDRPMKTPRTKNDRDARDLEEPRALTTTETLVAWSVVALLLIGVAALSCYVTRHDFPPYYPPEGPMI